MPDVTEMLAADHRRVEQLFEQYRQTRSSAVVREICTELTVHAAIEEKVVYPALAGSVDGGKGMRRHSEQEHQEVKDAIFQIERLGYSRPDVDQYMEKIITGVTEHVQEEEGEIFPQMRRQMGQARLDELAQETAALKQELMGEAETAGPLIDLTKEKLYELAQEKNIPGRSDMTKQELISALSSR
ncbi:MAG TPA: hemerythrin domain-containing protein [Acidimicrobiales bacterium]|nr:hemerythrin domain-containing protein [Acidimicrobiales bacterium]